MFNIRSLPTSLGYWLVSNYDPRCNQLNLGTHVITITPQTVYEVLGIPMGKVHFRKLKNPTMKDAVIAEFRNQFDIADKLPVPKNVFDHLKVCKDTRRQFQLNFLVLFITIMGEIAQGKKQIPAISFFKNDTTNKLSAGDEEKEKEKEVETETVKGDRKRKGGDKEEKEQDPSAVIGKKPSKKLKLKSKRVETETKDDVDEHQVNLGGGDIGQKMLSTKGYGKYKSEEIFDAIDEWRFRLNDSMLEDVITEVKKVEGQNNNEGAGIADDVIKNVCKDISKQHTNEVVINETTQGEGGEDGEKNEEKGNEKKPTQEEKTEKAQRVIEKVADPGAKAGKTSSSKPSVPASIGYVLPGLQTA
ncbi:hypothetical protein L1987_43501 [Smallanthus sonchifolius]|uniref:Uncharacterized protein n=1 Tax=Smallanthus sonchifolius TaxID=185202 RepID=A0ACB9GLV0_9ASTR|nr:hypothetical protein L1987_43501 [Smallanthus sonchifolius]